MCGSDGYCYIKVVWRLVSPRVSYTFDDNFGGSFSFFFLPQRKSVPHASVIFNNLVTADRAGKLNTHTGNKQSYNSRLSLRCWRQVDASYGCNIYEVKVNDETVCLPLAGSFSIRGSHLGIWEWTNLFIQFHTKAEKSGTNEVSD